MLVMYRENGSVTYGGNGSSERKFTACGDLRAVLSEGLEDVLGLALVWLEQLALPEHCLRETQQRVVREHVRPDLAVVVVVKPVGGLDLEEEALEGFLLLGGAVDDETQRQVVDHVLQVRRRANIARSSSHERCSERRGEVWTATKKEWGRNLKSNSNCVNDYDAEWVQYWCVSHTLTLAHCKPKNVNCSIPRAVSLLQFCQLSLCTPRHPQLEYVSHPNGYEYLPMRTLWLRGIQRRICAWCVLIAQQRIPS